MQLVLFSSACQCIVHLMCTMYNVHPDSKSVGLTSISCTSQLITMSKILVNVIQTLLPPKCANRISLMGVYFSQSVPIYLPIYLSIYLYLSIYIYISISIYIYLPLYLSIYLYISI